MVNGSRVLVAYIIPREGQKPAVAQLRKYVQEKLPEYMAPSHYVFMTSFPETPNRKIDRNALPPPDPELARGENDPERPVTEIEENLAGIWKELLGIQRMGRQDNFFEAGGHSALAMQLVARVRKLFKVDLVLRNVFERQTLAGMAELIEALSWRTSRQGERAGEREVVDV